VNVNVPNVRVTRSSKAAGAKTCAIVAEAHGAQYGWRWECGDKRSRGVFRYFYDCVQDARKHGCAVDFAYVAESLKGGRCGDA
jgi:hypothetical protein